MTVATIPTVHTKDQIERIAVEIRGCAEILNHMGQDLTGPQCPLVYLVADKLTALAKELDAGDEEASA